jgi:hypothetical protein
MHRPTKAAIGLTRGFEPVTHPAWRGPGEGTEPSDQLMTALAKEVGEFRGLR